jgi:death on curing protein
VRKKPKWLSVELIKAIHLSLLHEHGGLAGRVNETGLASSIARPQQLANYAEPKPSVYALAASYGYGLARNHCFSDGNKRVALMAIYTFLAINDIELDAPEPEAVLMIQDLAAGRLNEAELCAWIKSRAIKFIQD